VPTNVFQGLFQSDPDQGSLRRANGLRLAAVPADFLLTLHLYLYERFGEKSQDLLYRSGFEQGLLDMVQLNQHLRAQYGGGNCDLWQMDAKFILDTWWEPLAQGGWGCATFTFGSPARGVSVVDVEECAVAVALGSADHPVCHFAAGLFAGAISFYERAERHATELECLAAGGARCRFVVAAGGEIDSAETWRQEGVLAQEIVRRLQ
jgi:predicted hydrocarbon binding protein